MVTPAANAPRPTALNKHRPINLTSVVCKVLVTYIFSLAQVNPSSDEVSANDSLNQVAKVVSDVSQCSVLGFVVFVISTNYLFIPTVLSS